MTWSRLLELAFVFVLPVVCLAVDFRVGGLVSATAPAGFAVALVIGMIAYAAGKRPQGQAMHGFLAGLMDLGLVLSGIVFLVLLPFSILFIRFGIGVLGFVPLGTAYFYGRRTRIMYAENDRSTAWKRYGALGVVVGLVVPFCVHMADSRYIATAAHKLSSADAQVRLAGLTTLSRYPLCLNRCGAAVCSHYAPARSGEHLSGVSATPVETQVLIKMLGPNFRDDCIRIQD
jgi:hypothetical protein